MSPIKSPSHSLFTSINLLTSDTNTTAPWTMTLHDTHQVISLVFSRPDMESIEHIVTGYTDIHQLFQDLKAVLLASGLTVAPSSIQVANRMVSTAFTVAINRAKSPQGDRNEEHQD
jgi:transcriptional regulatory protein LevR